MDNHPLFYDQNNLILRVVLKEGFYCRARPSCNGGTLLLYFALVLLIYPRLSKITTGTI